MDSSPDTPWLCPTCGATVFTPFCGACGEQRLPPDHLSLRHYLAAAAESMFSWDGRILGTLASFLRRPGELTVAYLEGQRKPYLNPLQLFLLINVLFFLQQGVTGWNTYSTPWSVHIHEAMYADLARSLARWRLDLLGIPYEGPRYVAYVARFNAAVGLTTKSLLVLMVPFVTALVALVRLGRPRQVAVHLTVALHLTAYLLALQTVVLPIVSAIQRLAVRYGTPLDEGAVDVVSLGAILLLLAIVCVPLVRRVFGSTSRAAVVQAAVLALLIFVCVELYRVVLFVITLFTTT